MDHDDANSLNKAIMFLLDILCEYGSIRFSFFYPDSEETDRQLLRGMGFGKDWYRPGDLVEAAVDFLEGDLVRRTPLPSKLPDDTNDYLIELTPKGRTHVATAEYRAKAKKRRNWFMVDWFEEGETPPEAGMRGEQEIEMARRIMKSNACVVRFRCCGKQHTIEATADGKLILHDHKQGKNTPRRNVAAPSGEWSYCNEVKLAHHLGAEHKLPRNDKLLQHSRGFRLCRRARMLERLMRALLLGIDMMDKPRKARGRTRSRKKKRPGGDAKNQK